MPQEVNLKELKSQSQIDTKAREDMERLLAELREKMSEIDIIAKELKEKGKELDRVSPQKTKRLLEEIKVPPLEMLQ